MCPRILCGVVGLAFMGTMFAAIPAQGEEIRVTLLGTGSPSPAMNRFGPSILVEAGTQKFLFDAGRGALQRLNQVKVSWRDIQGLFFTHLHSDHVVGFPDLWLTGWLVGRRAAPLEVWGPQGTKNMLSHLQKAYEIDIRIRQEDDKASPEGVALHVEEIAEGFVYEKAGVKVTAFEVDHAPFKPAFGFRIDFGGRSVVLSGDTRISENLIRHAQSVDLLIHEVVVEETLRRAGFPEAQKKSVVAHHVTPEQAGEVFSRVKPRLAVYSHMVLPTATEQDIIPPTRSIYGGAVIVGEDLMVIKVGDKVEVIRPTGPSS